MLTRVQRKRTKGYRLPPRTMCCTRPGPLGNPFTAPITKSAYDAVEAFRVWTRWATSEHTNADPDGNKRHEKFLRAFAKLKGMVEAGEVDHLACYCGEGPCHVDVLIEMLEGNRRGGSGKIG